MTKQSGTRTECEEASCSWQMATVVQRHVHGEMDTFHNFTTGHFGVLVRFQASSTGLVVSAAVMHDMEGSFVASALRAGNCTQQLIAVL